MFKFLLSLLMCKKDFFYIKKDFYLYVLSHYFNNDEKIDWIDRVYFQEIDKLHIIFNEWKQK